MKIKSTTYYWLAVASGGVGMLFGLGFEGNFEALGIISDTDFITAMVLLLAAVFFMRLGFAAEDRERAAKRHKCGKINRTHARNPEYPENQERGA